MFWWATSRSLHYFAHLPADFATFWWATSRSLQATLRSSFSWRQRARLGTSLASNAPLSQRILQPFGGQHPVLRRPPCAVLCPFTGRLLSSFSWRQKATLGTSLASNASGRHLLCQDHGTDARALSSSSTQHAPRTVATRCFATQGLLV